MAAAFITSFWLKVRYREPPQQDSSLRNIVAHAGTVKTILLVVVAAFVGVFIGMNKGIFLSGTLIELIGIRPTYQSYAVVALLLFVPMLVACWLSRRRKDQDHYRAVKQESTDIECMTHSTLIWS